MKHKFLIASSLLLLLASCNPMKSAYDELEAEPQPVVKTYELTLTASDYKNCANYYVKQELAKFNGSDDEKTEFEKKLKYQASRVTKMEAFSDQITEQATVPQLLQSLYSEWGKGSAVQVNYNKMLPASDNIQKIGGEIVEIKLNADELSGIDVTDVNAKLSNEQLQAIFNLANGKNEAGAKSILIQAVIKKRENQRTMLFIDGKLADSRVYYILSKEDYTEMGSKYGNFSKSMQPADYLPIFLNNKFAYAKDGYTKVIIYQWYDKKKTSVRYDEYARTNGSWAMSAAVEARSSQFIHTGSEFLFDPTIYYTISKDDFVTLYNWVKENKPGYIAKKYGDNTETWFGGSSYYGNFNVDPNEGVGPCPEYDGKTPEEIVALTKQHIEEGLAYLLSVKYPDLTADVSGIEQKVVLAVNIRENRQNAYYTYIYKCEGNGQFVKVEGPTAL